MRAGRSARQWKDPDKIYPSQQPSPKELLRTGQWDSRTLETMDAQFRLAMTAAIECGAEHCVTGTSTHFGTRAPVAGYQRD